MKRCATCKTDKPLAEFAGRRLHCRECRNAARRATRDYAAESASKRAAEQRDPAGLKRKVLARAKRARDTISDGYIRSKLFAGIPAAAIPRGLIEAKRELLKLKRALWKDDNGRE